MKKNDKIKLIIWSVLAVLLIIFAIANRVGASQEYTDEGIVRMECAFLRYGNFTNVSTANYWCFSNNTNTTCSSGAMTIKGGYVGIVNATFAISDCGRGTHFCYGNVTVQEDSTNLVCGRIIQNEDSENVILAGALSGGW